MRIMQRQFTARLAVAGLATMALAACSGGGGDQAAAPAPEPFGPAGYQGIGPGTAQAAALAAGKLATAPVSTLDGCTAFSWTGGPAPDAARMAADEAAQKKAKDLNDQADAAEKNPDAPAGTSAADSAKAAAADAKVAQLSADAAMASADLAVRREAWEKAFATAGGASFGKAGLHELAAPAAAKTAEGIGVGSTLADLHKAYDARGLKTGETGRFELAIPEKSGWRFEFTPGPDGKVAALMLTDGALRCS